MKIAKSKFGLILSFVYVLILITFIIYTRSACGGNPLCGLIEVLPALPWLFILIALVDFYSIELNFIFTLGYTVSLLINVIIIYFIGLFIQRMFEKIRNKQQIK